MASFELCWLEPNLGMTVRIDAEGVRDLAPFNPGIDSKLGPVPVEP